jgi:hypothetical protein
MEKECPALTLCAPVPGLERAVMVAFALMVLPRLLAREVEELIVETELRAPQVFLELVVRLERALMVPVNRLA